MKKTLIGLENMPRFKIDILTFLLSLVAGVLFVKWHIWVVFPLLFIFVLIASIKWSVIFNDLRLRSRHE